MKKVLVTGGTGFIGKNILESYLKDKYTLVAPTRAELDCGDEDSVKAYFAANKFDIVIHAAVKPAHRNAGDTSGVLYVNSRMVFNLLKHQGRWGKLLNMGSGSIYDMRHYQPKMKESYFDTYIPADELGYYKYILGKLLPATTGVYDLRIFGIFGKYEDYAIRFISNAICKAMYDLPITLKQNRKFDYFYIDDLMPVLEHFMENDPAEKAFNVTPDRSVGLLDIAGMVQKLSGKDVAIKVGMDGLGVEYSGDNSLLRSEMKNLQLTPLEVSVEKLYRWYEQQRPNINKQLLLTDK